MPAMKDAGWVIVLQGLSAYAAIISAYLFIYPVIISQKLTSHRDLLSRVRTEQKDLRDLLDQASESLAAEADQRGRASWRWNWSGLIVLILSFLLLTSAVMIQLGTDPAFHSN